MVNFTSRTCSATNTAEYEQEHFFDFGDGTWTPHKIGWTISGACAVATTIITFVSLGLHALNYQIPAQQRQVGRILLMPWVYGVMSFLSYRYFRDYIYFELIQVSYEGIVISAFLLLLVEFVSASASKGDVRNALARKEKVALPMTFGLLRFRASKPAFIHVLKWSVLQYAFFRPAISIVGIICEAFGKLCPEEYSVYFAEVYLEAFDFVVISVCLYGLVVWYDLTKPELKGKQPLSKFLCIKLIVFFTFYQSFVISALAKHGVLKASDYWTITNVSDGLNALIISCEMTLFSCAYFVAFPAKEYAHLNLRPRTFGNYLRFIWDVVWFGDFAMELWTATLFFIDYLRGKPGTRSKDVDGFDHRVARVFGATSEDHDLPMSSTGAGLGAGGGGGKGEAAYAPLERGESRTPSGRGRDVNGTWR